MHGLDIVAAYRNDCLHKNATPEQQRLVQVVGHETSKATAYDLQGCHRLAVTASGPAAVLYSLQVCSTFGPKPLTVQLLCMLRFNICLEAQPPSMQRASWVGLQTSVTMYAEQAAAWHNSSLLSVAVVTQGNKFQCLCTATNGYMQKNQCHKQGWQDRKGASKVMYKQCCWRRKLTAGNSPPQVPLGIHIISPV